MTNKTTLPPNSPRFATAEELDEIATSLKTSTRVGLDWQQIDDMIERDVVILPKYISDGPGYAGPVAIIIHGEPQFVTILTRRVKHDKLDWWVEDANDSTPLLELTPRQRKLIEFAEGTLSTLEYLQEWDAETLDRIAYDAKCMGLATSDDNSLFQRTGLKKFSVRVRLADEYMAANESEALTKMLDALEARDGMEIMGHDIVEEQDT